MKMLPRRTRTTAVTSPIYEVLGLSDLPFSLEPVLDPYSEDPRQNGTIYAQAPVRGAMEKFERLLIRPDDFANRTRIASLWSKGDAESGRGMGKTALLRFFQQRVNHDWGEAEFRGQFSAAVVYVSFREQVDRRYMEQLAWAALVDICRNGVLEVSRAAIRRDQLSDDQVAALSSMDEAKAVEGLLDDDFLSSHGISGPELDDQSKEALRKAGVQEAVAQGLASGSFEAYLRGLRRDGNLEPYYVPRDNKGLDYARRILFDDIVRYLLVAGFDGGYLFVDDIENLTDQMTRRHRREFAKEFALCTVRPGHANVLHKFFSCVLTTHQASASGLAQAWTEAGLSAMTRLEPGAPTSVELPLPTEAQARQILIEHLDYYRLDAKKRGTIEPFSEDGLAALVGRSQHPRTLIANAARVVMNAAERRYSTIGARAVAEAGAGEGVDDTDFGAGLDDAL